MANNSPDPLLEKCLMERTGNPDDKRGQCLSLSATGSRKVPVLARLADENDAALLAVLREDEQERLRTLLRALIDKHGLSVIPID